MARSSSLSWCKLQCDWRTGAISQQFCQLQRRSVLPLCWHRVQFLLAQPQCSALVWGVAVMYLHMHYMKNWLLSLITYVLIYVEIMALLTIYYGARFVSEGPSGAAIDFLYYIIVFAWFAGCSVFAVRTYELTERESFYGKYQQEQRAREWKRLLEDLPEPVIFAKNGKIRFFNRATLDLLGIVTTPEREDVVVLEKLDGLKQKETEKSLKEYMENNSRDAFKNGSLFVGWKNGKKIWVMIKCVKAEGTQGKEGMMEYIFEDVSALKHLERNRAKEQCFDLLLATASHDIRTPLNLLLGVVDVLTDFVKTPRGLEQINVARCCGQRMIHYLKGLTFIRQLNLGTLTPTKKLFNPAEIALEIVRINEFSAEAKKLKLELSVEPGVPTAICSDNDMYAIILENLVENAIKYTFTGNIKVCVSLAESTKTLVTEVIDTGIGMDLNQLANVGVLFKKSKLKCSMNPQGLGLGLFLAKSLSKQLEGDLEISSEVGKGTVARFTICGWPLEDARTERIRSECSIISTSIPLNFNCECARVLLVDDEPFNLLILSAYLASINLKADKAENGELALTIIRQKAECTCCKGYSVVFMDINMPVMDGIVATTKITEMIKEGVIPKCVVIAVTAASGLDSPSVYNRYTSKGFSELRTFVVVYLLLKQCQSQCKRPSLYTY
eukprot:TRINITY_DN88546_c0_g1_i1.p1 TRINITY_DN88546_c0_g1~~TRINITY_DN88546_c0_g1_i1.p1  ORF type:complete len:669 (+),score=41.09 TRINITY_DN88546_c0_g1_i1:448-2454(+)